MEIEQFDRTEDDEKPLTFADLNRGDVFRDATSDLDDDLDIWMKVGDIRLIHGIANACHYNAWRFNLGLFSQIPDDRVVILLETQLRWRDVK